MAAEVRQFPCREDNYGFLLHDTDSGLAAAIDTPDVGAIDRALAEAGWSLSHIFNTHHHYDHAGGNLALKERHGCTIVGPAADARRIPGIDIEVAEGDRFALGKLSLEVFDTPGHTRGHIVYYLPHEGIAFVGDTLFAMGCGRLFEGTPGQMWKSLQKLLQWPAQTRLYCAHEYTLANGEFALTVDPHNEALQERVAAVRVARAAGQPTVPTMLELERATNPFLRVEDPELQSAIGMEGADPVQVFSEVRERKDHF